MKLKLIATGMLLGIAAGGCDRPTTGERIPVYDRPQVALVVVSGRQPVHDHDSVIAATNRLIEGTRPQGVELVYVREPSEGDSDAGVRVVNDQVFSSSRGDAFSNPELDRFFRSHAVDHLVLVGSIADPSIELTARGALNRGYKVMVASDAIAAASEARRNRAVGSLRRAGVEIAESERVLAEWSRRKHYLGSR